MMMCCDGTRNGSLYRCVQQYRSPAKQVRDVQQAGLFGARRVMNLPTGGEP
jgi:hypothetical protein